MWKHLVTRGLAPKRRARHDRDNRRSASRLTVEELEGRLLLSGDMVLQWNSVLQQAARNAPASPVPLFRNLALVHVAIYEAVNAIDHTHTPYLANIPAPSGASEDAAAAEAAHDTLVALYPAQQALFDAKLEESLATVGNGDAKAAGIQVGQAAAQNILAARANDGSDAYVPYPGSTGPGQWRPTPPTFVPDTQAHIPLITPFAVTSSAQFRPEAPPALTSAEYAAAFNEVKALGAVNSTTRTREQTVVALLWELPINGITNWEQVAQRAALAQGTSLADNARLFALLNMSMSDALESSFESKFYYGLWRPVTAVQKADEDGNPDTEADPSWTQLIITPPYPTYAGNAATLSMSSATILTSFFGTNDIPFDINWQTFNVTRSYAGFQQAAQETADSRIWGGIHFRFDNVAGQAIGSSVAHYVFDNFLTPLGSNPAPARSGRPGNALELATLSLPVDHPALFSAVSDTGGNFQVMPVQALASESYYGIVMLSPPKVRNVSSDGQGGWYQTVHAPRWELAFGSLQGLGDSLDQVA